MTFSIIAGGNFPPVASDEFPNFIQFQKDGVDLGGANIDVVDFVGENIAATRGTGENANKLTVSVASNPSSPTPGGSAPPTLVVSLEAQSNGAFDNVDFFDWVGTVVQASADAELDAPATISIIEPGLYRVGMHIRLDSPVALFPTGNFGARLSTALGITETAHWKTEDGNSGQVQYQAWVDEFVLDASAASPGVPVEFIPVVYANAYNGGGTLSSWNSVLLTLQRITP